MIGDRESDFMYKAPIDLTEQESLKRVVLDIERITHSEHFDPRYPEREMLYRMRDIAVVNTLHAERFGRSATDVLMEQLGGQV